MKYSTLFQCRNSVIIPPIGYGTWQTPDEATAEAVNAALQIGYRHVDTAYAYLNEKGVGEGIRKSGIKREDIFVTTKHWITDRGYEKTVAEGEASLKNLGLDYVDLYLIHWPAVKKRFADWKEINLSTWSGFEKLYGEGKARAIGVSNFLPEHIEALEEKAKIPVQVNQIEFHPGYAQLELVEWCHRHGIIVEAWSPLGCGKVLSDLTVNAIAQAHGKSSAQICIRYALQHGVIPLPKSVHAERIRSNLEVMDFELSEDEISRLDEMPQIGYSGYYPENAPADALVYGDI